MENEQHPLRSAERDMVPSGEILSLGESLECYKAVRKITVLMIKSKGIFVME